MTVTLRPITKDNYLECMRLRVAPEQEGFVASNAFSLANAAYVPGCTPLAIYADETMVGFIMSYYIAEQASYEISRLMIDAGHQGKGYGKAAMKLMIDHLHAYPDCKTIDISYEPENDGARRLYTSLGFIETGEIEEGEVVARLSLS